MASRRRSAPRSSSRASPPSPIGINIQVLQPGEPNCMYHGETGQEDFLVLSGECLLLIEGEERPLKQWDFVHSPPWTEHVFVGAGDGPCVILMVGARPENEELAIRCRGRAKTQRRRGRGDQVGPGGLRSASPGQPLGGTGRAPCRTLSKRLQPSRDAPRKGEHEAHGLVACIGGRPEHAGHPPSMTATPCSRP